MTGVFIAGNLLHSGQIRCDTVLLKSLSREGILMSIQEPKDNLPLTQLIVGMGSMTLATTRTTARVLLKKIVQSLSASPLDCTGSKM